MWGYAKEIMDICERAVVSAADSQRMHFGRGLAWAITNEYTGAIADFEVHVEWTKDKGFYDPFGLTIEASSSI